MAFSIGAGELRTPIRLQNSATTGQGAHETTAWVDIGNQTADDPPIYTRSKWVSTPGRLAYLSNAMQTLVSAEVTVRYNAAVTEQTRVVCGGVAHDIIDVDDPDQHKRWLVLKLKASVNS